jgi:hypothetical protein
MLEITFVVSMRTCKRFFIYALLLVRGGMPPSHSNLRGVQAAPAKPVFDQRSCGCCLMGH